MTVRIFVVLLLIVGIPAAALARWQAAPSIQLVEEYNDNIFLSAAAEEDDWITTIVPGVKVQWQTSLLDFDLDYGLNFIYFHDNSAENEVDFKDVQRVKSSLTLFPQENFNIEASETIQRVEIDERKPGIADNEFTNKTSEYRFFLKPQYLWQPTQRFKTLLHYQLEDVRYQSSQGDDSFRHGIHLRLEQEVSARLKLVGGGHYEKLSARRYEDSDQQQLYLGFENQLATALLFKAQLGSTWIDFEDRSRERTTTANVTLEYQPSTRLLASLQYLRSVESSVSRGVALIERYEAHLHYVRRLESDLSLFWSDAQFYEENSRDRSQGALLQFSLPLSATLIAGMDGSYTEYEFDPESQDAWKVEAGASMTYQRQQYEVTLRYAYSHYDDDFDPDDFRSHIVSLAVGLRY